VAPDGEPSAVGLGERERVHEDVVDLVEYGLGEGLGPSGIDRLQADAHRIGTQAVDVALQVGVGVERESGAGVLDDADFDSALFAELERLVDRERVAQVDVIVVDGERGLGRSGFRGRGMEVKTPISPKSREKWGTPGYCGSGYGCGLKKISARMRHDEISRRTGENRDSPEE
jgi:hypothetical protein